MSQYIRDAKAFRVHVVAPAGATVAALPEDYITITVGGKTYYYYWGTFYVQAPGGYAIVAAPVGAVVPYLPDGYSTAFSGGARLYVYGSVRYRPYLQGGVVVYKVVTP